MPAEFLAETAPMAADKPRVGYGFILLYLLAYVGAFIAFVPLLQILVPLRASAIGGAHQAALLSRVGLCGAVAASIGNIVFGALSDSTRSARGRRRPWLFAGLAATIASYGLVWGAATPWGLLGTIIAFQLGFNALFAPLGAVLADDVPDNQKGLVSALLGLGYPIGSAVGTLVIGAWLVGDAARFAAVGVMVALCVLPFALRLRGSQSVVARRHLGWQRLPAARSGDVARAWGSRLLVSTAANLAQSYMLFFLLAHGAIAGAPALRPEALLARLTVIITMTSVACGLAGGVLSDRAARRKPFVIGGALAMAAGLAGIASAQGWPELEAAAAVYGAGFGLYNAVDLALMLQVLPSLDHAGQDLGLLNLANTLPQIFGPLLALAVLRLVPGGYAILFLIAAACALLGGGAALRIRGVR